MDATTFPFRDNFPTLTDAQINDAIGVVSVDWYGIFSLFATLPADISAGKRNNLLGYLVAWWLCVHYPSSVVGMPADGGKPLSSKSIGGVSVSFATMNTQEGLEIMNSNIFGTQALLLITGSIERHTIWGL